jgi:aminoglycoside phosphotransferase (APT) family kinase protein
VSDFQAQVTAALRALLGQEVEVRECRRLTAGASLETYKVDLLVGGVARRYALRRRNEHAAAALAQALDLRTEADLLRLAVGAGIPGPCNVLSLETSHGLGEGYFMDWIEGETLGNRIVAIPELAEARASLASECGEVLAAIHGIDVDRGGLGHRLPRLRAEEAVRAVMARYDAIASPQPMIEFAARWLLSHLPAASTMTLVHGDFRNGNLIVRPSGLVAVLDWELAHIGDPIEDLGWLCCNSWRFGREDLPVGGFGTHEQLLDSYERATGAVVDRDVLHFWTVFGTFSWAVGCLQMCRRGGDNPGEHLERLAIGRRSSESQLDLAGLLVPGEVNDHDWPEFSSIPDVSAIAEGLGSYLDTAAGPEASPQAVYYARIGKHLARILARELRQGPLVDALERARLEKLVGFPDQRLPDLRAELCRRLRLEPVDLTHAALAVHLRQTAYDRVLINRPGYSGLRLLAGARQAREAVLAE